MADPKVVRCRMRMYQVGFGDCFVFSFEYDGPLADGRDIRHILVDFGSTKRPTGWQSLNAIAKQIFAHTQGMIDVVVVSHRHRDHLSGFSDPAFVQTFMSAGFPKLVVRSWTERPELATDATAGPAIAGAQAFGLGPKSAALLGQLATAQRFADELSGKLKGASNRSLAAEVEQLADDQLNNAEAVKQLNTWAGPSGRYLSYGQPSGIEAVVPGISVRVIGPPTVDEHPAVIRQRSRDPNEFWMIYSGLVEGLPSTELIDVAEHDGTDPVPDTAESMASAAVGSDTAATTQTFEPRSTAPPVGEPGPTRWLTERMGRQNLNAFLRVVNLLDDVLNNTSVILLIDIPTPDGPLRLLLPGDAQIENWEYALKHAADKSINLDLLREVDVYKVGHHGSRNATPRTLFNLWADTGRPLVGLMSTKSGVHGKTPATFVPRQTLVAALDTRTDEHLYSTEGITAATPYVELLADVSTGRAIEVVTSGSRRSVEPG
jgi:hypothetical protein